jgi:hypothetical protein
MGFRWDGGDPLSGERRPRTAKETVCWCLLWKKKKSVIRLQQDEQQEGQLVAMHQ